ncbi:MAG: hypothetical protein K1W24_16250 [Lachnospiraceae bacterium]
MRRLKENKGSITVMAVAGMIFVVVLISIVFIAISNKKTSQTKDIERIETNYDSNMERIYKDTVNNTNEL